MSLEELRSRILQAMPEAEVEVLDLTGSGDHLEARVVSRFFESKSRVAQHQMVYGSLADLLASGEVHALALKTFTPDEWSRFCQSRGSP